MFICKQFNKASYEAMIWISFSLQQYNISILKDYTLIFAPFSFFNTCKNSFRKLGPNLVNSSPKLSTDNSSAKLSTVNIS